jgi:hypothetical protein
MKYYFCNMIKKVFLSIYFLVSVLSHCEAQVFFKTADLFRKPDTDEKSGSLNIIQQSGVDTLISRYVLANRKLNGGLEGFRIQIFRSANRTAKEESSKERAKFMTEFPDIPSYPLFAPPAYFLVRAGDYRTKMEGTKQLISIRRKFPNAYLVPDVIIFPDLNKK